MVYLIVERAKRARHSQVCTIVNRGYIIMVRSIKVYSAGVPYAARSAAVIIIESYLKAISSDYGSNKEY